jgi:hypothetical protein
MRVKITIVVEDYAAEPYVRSIPLVRTKGFVSASIEHDQDDLKKIAPMVSSGGRHIPPTYGGGRATKGVPSEYHRKLASHFDGKSGVTTTEVRAFAVKQGYSKNGISSALGLMQKSGLVRSGGRNSWAFKKDGWK